MSAAIHEIRPRLGQRVMYVTRSHVQLPAVVVKVYDDATVDLQVFHDTRDGTFLERAVQQNLEKRPKTWHELVQTPPIHRGGGGGGPAAV